MKGRETESKKKKQIEPIGIDQFRSTASLGSLSSLGDPMFVDFNDRIYIVRQFQQETGEKYSIPRSNLIDLN